MATKTKHSPKHRDSPRVLGIGKDIRDAVLVAGERPLLAVIGGAILEATITRTIAGVSNIQLVVHDPERKLLRKGILEEKWTMKIDGLHFRYKGSTKSGADITMNFIEENAARMQEVKGARKAYRDQVTRAEFILSEIREVKGAEIPVRIFELHKDQPIKTEKDRQAKKDKRNESGEEHTQGEYGLGATDVGKVTVKHDGADAGQIHIIDAVLDTGMSMGMSFKLLICAVMTITQESDVAILNSPEGYGPFSQLKNGAWPASGDPAKDAAGFFKAALKVAKENPDMAKGDLCQAVQAAGAGELYSQWEDEATNTVETFLGGSDVGSVEQTVKERYAFEREKKENAWTNSHKLAEEVHWRRFMVAGKFFYVPDTFLMRGKRRAIIDEDTRGIDTIDYEDHENLEVLEATVQCRAQYWKVPPGCIVRVDKKMGPAAGDYLVTSIEGSMFDNDKEIEVKIHKPIKPLKEPAPETHTNSLSVPGGATSSSGMGALEGTAEDVVNEVIDYAHANGFPNVTRSSVRAANAEHGPTIDGGRSDHQGPPETAWAADISNGVSTPEEAALAKAIAEAFGIPWDGAGLVTHETGGYRLQLIHNTMEGGDHYDHVHFGCEVV